jgi:pyruvate/2-oxoglutarate dehydrogenase complex dihydrolipoamide dehydrogenase (E3) component
VDVYFGYGRFASEKTITVNGRTLEFKRAVIATGGLPAFLPIPGLKELYEKANAATDGDLRPAVMTNETMFNLTSRPERLVVLGAGVVGMELAQAMQRLGSSVVVIGRSGRVLPKEDEDLAGLVKDQMVKDGVEFRLSTVRYTSVELTGKVRDNGLPELLLKFEEVKDGATVQVELVCDALLVAAGREPNVTGMDLEKAGIKYDSKVGLTVTDGLQTTNPRVFGVGDCCSAFKFTHAADFMARMVIRNALFLGREKMSALLIPSATFTSPEIASVGLYERDLVERGIAFNTYEKHFSANDRAICDSSTTGMVRIRVDTKTDAILGASICGAGAGNMISEITLAMQSGTGLGKLAAVIHPYPTTAESIRQAGDLYNRGRLTTTVRGLLRGLIKIQR